MKALDIAIAKQMDDRRNLLRYPDGPLAPARPIVPTVDTFNTGGGGAVPNNLEKTVNGNPTDSAGVGTTVIGSAGNIGIFYFDLGVPKLLSVKIIADAWVTTGTLYVNMGGKLASGDNYKEPGYSLISTSITSETGVKLPCLSVNMYARYIRIRVNGSAAMTGNFKVYEVIAEDIGI